MNQTFQRAGIPFSNTLLEERGKLTPNCRGLGFAVGTEPLASYFASRGCQVLATDLDRAESSEGWINQNEHAASLEQVYFKEYIERPEFDRLVSFQSADMRTLDRISGKYDFLWSSCALEHLGSLEAGIRFVLDSSRFLNPGGVAVHTTEFNVSSGISTVEVGDNVVFRASDLIRLSNLLESNGFYVRPFNFDCGDATPDIEYDFEPYFSNDRFHIKLDSAGYTCTSCSIIIENKESPFKRPAISFPLQKPTGLVERLLKEIQRRFCN